MSLFLKENCVNKVSLKIYSKIPSVVCEYFYISILSLFKRADENDSPKNTSRTWKLRFLSIPKEILKSHPEKNMFFYDFVLIWGKEGLILKSS